MNEDLKNLGPYIAEEGNLKYKGNKIFDSKKEVRNKKAPDLSNRHKALQNDDGRWEAIINLHDAIHKASTDFMDEIGAKLFDLPITTRMISSPGSLTGTIPEDVEPFKIDFFEHETFLTQSSQLYLEFAVTSPNTDKVYCWEKSFRRERADYRHFPEFSHIEFEGSVDFEENLNIQEKYLKYLINYILNNYKEDLKYYLNKKDIESLKKMTNIDFKRITFHEAFEELYKRTGSDKYKDVTIDNFGAYEEVLLSRIHDGVPLFVTNYIAEEVAFYHANKEDNPDLAVNADFMFPCYGEDIGSGQRVLTKKEIKDKAEHFKLNMDDYEAYIESRGNDPVVHSGWGMGIERFIQWLLKLPYIWDAKVFPRVDNSKRP